MPLQSRTVSAKTPDAIDAIVGHNIRIQRMTKGTSQSELAAGLGVTFQQVQKYEKGVNRVGSGRLHRVADFFGVPITAFYEGVRAGRGRARGPSALRLIAAREPFRLVRAFAQIKDRSVRRAIVGLVEKVAATSTRD